MMKDESEVWVSAACQVLTLEKRPMHYQDIKRAIQAFNLMATNHPMKTTLESALFKEIQKPDSRVKRSSTEPGVFLLTDIMEDTKSESTESPQIITYQSLQASSSMAPKTPSTMIARTPVTTITPVQSAPQSQLPVSQTVRFPTQTQGTIRVVHPGHPKIQGHPKVQGHPRVQGHKVAILGHRSVLKSKQKPVVQMNGIQEKYKAKYIRLKKCVKEMMFLNASVCDDVTRMEEKVAKAKEERKFLLRKLMQHQSVAEACQQMIAKQQAAAMETQLSPPASATTPVPPSEGAAEAESPSDGKAKKKAATKKKIIKPGIVVGVDDVPKAKKKKVPTATLR